MTALNRLAGKISEEEMSEMNYRVKVQGTSAENVARDYLKKNGFLQSAEGFGKVVVANE